MTSEPTTDRHREARDVDASLELALRDWLAATGLDDHQSQDDLRDAAETWLDATLASPADSLDEAWGAAERALIEAQGDEDGFSVDIAYWPEFPGAPWQVSANDVQVTAARLPDALRAALTAALSEEPR